MRTALELRDSLRLAEVKFLPAGNPPHRDQTQATAEMRLAMVRAAVEDEPGFNVDDREVRRTGLSYSVDTLTELRAENPDRSLCLLLGARSWVSPM
jgi:nicotinate-nucleotide adenylyltransferase